MGQSRQTSGKDQLPISLNLQDEHKDENSKVIDRSVPPKEDHRTRNWYVSRHFKIGKDRHPNACNAGSVMELLASSLLLANERITTPVHSILQPFKRWKLTSGSRTYAPQTELKDRKILKIRRKKEVAVAPEQVIREPTKGAEGRDAGLQRKEKSIQKRRLRKLSPTQIKRAGAYWKYTGKKGP